MGTISHLADPLIESIGGHARPGQAVSPGVMVGDLPGSGITGSSSRAFAIDLNHEILHSCPVAGRLELQEKLKDPGAARGGKGVGFGVSASYPGHRSTPASSTGSSTFNTR